VLHLYDVTDDKFVLLEPDYSAYATFDYPPPQGQVTYKDSYPLLELGPALA
jgi:hypothetical protein